MARLSLVVTATVMLPGCLVEDPPEYTPPTRTPPRLNLSQTLPPNDQIWVTQLGEKVEFRVGVSSEDAGTDVVGYLMVDYQGGGRWPTWDGGRVRASTLDDLTRQLTLAPVVEPPWLGLGCHRITLRVAHEDNFDIAGPPIVSDPEDMTEAFWWFNVIDPSSGQDGSVLTGCPTATKDTE